LRSRADVAAQSTQSSLAQRLQAAWQLELPPALPLLPQPPAPAAIPPSRTSNTTDHRTPKTPRMRRSYHRSRNGFGQVCRDFLRKLRQKSRRACGTRHLGRIARDDSLLVLELLLGAAVRQ
jgi:hypothetical protein